MTKAVVRFFKKLVGLKWQQFYSSAVLLKVTTFFIFYFSFCLRIWPNQSQTRSRKLYYNLQNAKCLNSLRSHLFRKEFYFKDFKFQAIFGGLLFRVKFHFMFEQFNFAYIERIGWASDLFQSVKILESKKQMIAY